MLLREKHSVVVVFGRMRTVFGFGTGNLVNDPDLAPGRFADIGLQVINALFFTGKSPQILQNLHPLGFGDFPVHTAGDVARPGVVVFYPNPKTQKKRG